MSREYPCVYYDNQKCTLHSEPGYTDWCVLGPCSHETPSNADHIRFMTDEELVDYMSEHSIDDFCYIICGGECKAVATFNKTSGQRCREIVADWLKQPYKEDT